MKKGLAIILLLVFLFNVGGYYIVYWALQIQVDQQLSYRLDLNLYDPQQTISLKIPVALPYPIHPQEYQRVDGKFQHNGEYYKLIKHQLKNDTLYIVCIRDQQTKELVSTIKDYVKLTQGLPGTNTSNKALQFLSKLVKDFCSQKEISIDHQDGFSVSVAFPEQPDIFIQPEIPIDSPPPRG